MRKFFFTFEKKKKFLNVKRKKINRFIWSFFLFGCDNMLKVNVICMEYLFISCYFVCFFFLSRMKCVNSHLRHPEIGFRFRSSIVNPHRPIDANIHASNSNMMSINNLNGTTNIVNIAACKIDRKKMHKKDDTVFSIEVNANFLFAFDK